MKRLAYILLILLVPALAYAYVVGTPSNMVPGNWQAFAVDPGAPDSGVTSTAHVTLKNLVTAIGTTKKSTIVFPHTGSGTTTQYTIGTALDLSSYSNITFQIENGAQLKVSTGVSGVTLPSPANVSAQPNQQIVSGTSLYFATPGTVYPEQFGAKSDGSTECSTTIQAAINSIPTAVNFSSSSIGGQVKFSGGKYKVSTTVNLKRGIRISGIWRESTQVISYIDGSVFTYSDIGNWIQDSIQFDNLSIIQDASVVPASGAGIEVLEGTAKSSSLFVDNVFVRGTYNGINGQTLIASKISNSRVSSCVNDGILINGTAASTSLEITSTYADLCGNDGISISLGAYIVINGGSSDSNTRYGYKIYQCSSPQLNGCGAEGNTDAQMYIYQSYGVTLLAPYTIAKAATAKDSIYLDDNFAVNIIGGKLAAGAGNTGYAIYQNTLRGPVNVTGTYFDTVYTSSTRTNKSSLINFNRCAGSGGFESIGNNNILYNSTLTAEGSFIASPGSMLVVPTNPTLGLSPAYLKTFGDSDTCWRDIMTVRYAATVPIAGTWKKGEICFNTAVTSGVSLGWVATVSGTFGTLSGVTGYIDSGVTGLGVNITTGLSVGNYITIDGVTGVKRITEISGTTVTVDSASDATVVGAAVAYQAPTMKGFGQIY